MTTSGTASRPYHHGDLRAALISAALEAVAENGTARLSLRDLSRRAGVSHAAPAHHFGDKTGLLTAVATEGFELLAEATKAAWERTGSFLEVGVAYVAFATAHPAHFGVMFQPGLYRADDPALAAARHRARAILSTGAAMATPGVSDDGATAGLAAWALMHGLATLCLTGNVTSPDPEQLARTVGTYLYATAAPTSASTSASTSGAATVAPTAASASASASASSGASSAGDARRASSGASTGASTSAFSGDVGA